MLNSTPKTVPSVDLEHDGNPIFCRCLFIFESLQEVKSKEKVFEVSIGGTLFGILIHVKVIRPPRTVD